MAIIVLKQYEPDFLAIVSKAIIYYNYTFEAYIYYLFNNKNQLSISIIVRGNKLLLINS